MSEIDTTKWVWMFDGAERAAGPFNSRERALADVRERIGDTGSATVQLGHPEPCDVAWHVPVDLDLLLERMEETAADNSFSWCDGDDVFDINGSVEEAENALAWALQEWAKKWVTSDKWTIQVTEEVRLEPLK